MLINTISSIKIAWNLYSEVDLLNSVRVLTAFSPQCVYVCFHVPPFACGLGSPPSHYVISGKVSCKGSVEIEHLVPL